MTSGTAFIYKKESVEITNIPTDQTIESASYDVMYGLRKIFGDDLLGFQFDNPSIFNKG